MALGDGSGWDETNPQQSTLANTLDSYDRDVRIGVRGRMALEHEWPSSQSVTSAAGYHKFITLQNQAAKPTISGTQLAAVYTKTVGAGLQELFYENEIGSEVQISNRTALNVSLVSQAVPKVVCRFSGTDSGSITPAVGFGVSTITKTATGDYLVTFATPFANTASIVLSLAVQMTAGNQWLVANIYTGPGSISITAARIYCNNENNNTPNDSPMVNVVIWGSQ